MTIAEQILDQVKALPEPLAREVLDFAQFLRLREEQTEWRDLVMAQSESLEKIWDNDSDKVWDVA